MKLIQGQGENMKKHVLLHLLLFLIGFFGYGLLEVVWRGYTHPTMGFAGGLSLCFLSVTEHGLKELKTVYKALLCGLFITAIELIIGIIMNIRLKAGVWDYSLMPMNFLGQISFTFSVMWCILSIPMMKITAMIRNVIFEKV